MFRLSVLSFLVILSLFLRVRCSSGNLHSEDPHTLSFIDDARRVVSPWSSDGYIRMSKEAIHPLKDEPKPMEENEHSKTGEAYDLKHDSGDHNVVCTLKVCEYDWVLEERHSMTWRTFDDKKGKLSDYQITVDEEDDRFNVVSNSFRPNPPYDAYQKKYKDPNDHLSQIFTTDGRPNRRIITINGKFPGPIIQVTKGAIVKVRVRNNMPIETASVHWHGIHQTNNYWMDGAPYLSQCPILPKQSFEYVWKAEADGTFWYHSHLAIQRNDGIFGMIIVHPSAKEVKETIPLFISDWFQVDSINLLTSNPFNFAGTKKSFGTAINHCLTNTLTYTKGVKVSSMCMDSILVNGRGLIRDSNPGLVHQNISSQFSHLGSTTERWHIPKNMQSVTMSIVHGGYEFPIRVFLLDGGSFEVLETDGTRIEPVEVDELILGVGESFEVVVPKPSNTEDNVRFLRSEILAECRSSECLKYDSIPFVDTELYFNSTSSKIVRDIVYVSTNTNHKVKERRCQSVVNGVRLRRECKIFNCPWGTSATPMKYDKMKKNATCVNIDQLKSIEKIAHGEGYDDYVPRYDEVPDRILNISFNFAHGSSINNIKFKYTTAPLYLPRNQTGFKKCQSGDGGIPDEPDSCTNVVTVNVGDIVEMRLIGAENPNSTYRRYMWTYHTVHLHGNELYVLKIGYPKVENNIITGLNENIECLNSACTKHGWNEKGLLDVDDFNSPVRKNTILIPAMGYTIVRFKATNPGYWPFHCHAMMHNLEGMLILLRIKDPNNPNRPVPPPGLPRCNSFEINDGSYPWEAEENTQKTDPKDPKGGEIQDAWFKEYLQREQKINFERLKQQEALLNITQKLLQDVKRMTYVN